MTIGTIWIVQHSMPGITSYPHIATNGVGVPIVDYEMSGVMITLNLTDGLTHIPPAPEGFGQVQFGIPPDDAAPGTFAVWCGDMWERSYTTSGRQWKHGLAHAFRESSE